MNILHALFFSDFKNRLLALALAVVTWVSVYRESTEQAKAAARIDLQRGADVEVLSIEDESGAPCASIEVTLNGPRGERARLRELRLAPTVELAPGSETPVTVTFEVTEDTLLLPPKFRLVAAKPARVRVRLDHRSRRYLSVAAAKELRPGDPPGAGLCDGKPAAGLRVAAVQVIPATVEVFGPRSVLSRFSAIPIVPVKIDGLPAGRHQLAAEVSGSLDGHAVSTTTQVSVIVDIAEEPQEAVFTARVDLVQGADYPNDYLAAPATREAEVRVRGPASAITELKSRPELLVVFVDIAGMRPEECQPVDDKELIATRPLEWRFRSAFPGSADLDVTIRKPEKPETVVTFRRRAKTEPPK